MHESKKKGGKENRKSPTFPSFRRFEEKLRQAKMKGGKCAGEYKRKLQGVYFAVVAVDANFKGKRAGDKREIKGQWAGWGERKEKKLPVGSECVCLSLSRSFSLPFYF